MPISESSAMRQLRRRSAQTPQLDLMADRMPIETAWRSLSLADTLIVTDMQNNYRQLRLKLKGICFSKSDVDVIAQRSRLHART